MLEMNLPVLQVLPVHPALQETQIPFSMSHVLYLQLVGHDSLQ